MRTDGMNRSVFGALCLWALCVASVCAGENTVQDKEGFTWDVGNNGTIVDGTNDTFDGGFALLVGKRMFEDNEITQVKENEFLIGVANLEGLNVKRRVIVLPEESCVVYAEIFENPTAEAISVQVRLRTEVGGNIGQVLPGPQKESGIAIGAYSQTGGGASVGERLSGDNMDFRANMDGRNGKFVVAEFKRPVVVPAGGKTVVLHLAVQRGTAEQALDAVSKLKLETFLKLLPEDERKRVVNVRASSGLLYLDTLELFRGEGTDVVRLRSGELIRGTVLSEALNLDSEFGPRKLAVKDFLSLFTSLDGSCRVALATGEILSGRVKEPALRLKLASGGELEIPFTHIAKFGRKLSPIKEPPAEGAEKPDPAPAEPSPERIVFTEPVFVLRGGDRVVGTLEQAQLSARTLYGDLTFPTAAFKLIKFPLGELRAPIFELKDGTQVCGYLGAEPLTVKLKGGGSVKLEPGRIQAICFEPNDEIASFEAPEKPADAKPNETTPPKAECFLNMVNGDVLAASLDCPEGILVLESPFGVQRFPQAEIAALQYKPEAFREVRVLLWDHSVLPGKLTGTALNVTLASGGKVAVPHGAIAGFNNSLPASSPELAAKVDALIPKLGDPDQKVREETLRALVELGSGTRLALLKHWNDADAEIRTRVREVFRAFVKDAAANAADALNTEAPDEPKPAHKKIRELKVENLQEDRIETRTQLIKPAPPEEEKPEAMPVVPAPNPPPAPAPTPDR